MNTARPLKFHSIKHNLFKRSERSHKGDNGHVLVIGGDHGFGGAALLSAEAALRSGAGLVSVATRPEHISAFLARRPELMVKACDKPETLSALIEAASVLVIGPGLGQSNWAQLCLKTALSAEIPLILDADALNLISQGLVDLPNEVQAIITPHPGEAARLLKCSVTDIENNRTQACLDLQRQFGGVSVLKGAGSLIAYEQNQRQQLDICTHGNPGMGSGGMGDVLSGVLGGLLAQGFSLIDSARLGVCIHSLSADQVAAKSGERGMLAGDLFPSIQKLVNQGD